MRSAGFVPNPEISIQSVGIERGEKRRAGFKIPLGFGKRNFMGLMDARSRI